MLLDLERGARHGTVVKPEDTITDDSKFVLPDIKGPKIIQRFDTRSKKSLEVESKKVVKANSENLTKDVPMNDLPKSPVRESSQC